MPRGRPVRRSLSPTRQPPVKGGSYDSELMRVLRERDELQGVMERYERHLSEAQANLRVLTADRDQISMHYQQAQEEIAFLRQEVLRSKSSSCRSATRSSVTAHSILRRVEAERDEASADLHRMANERDSLRERLKICQETAISERAHLEQRVEDLQKAVLTLEDQRGEQRRRQAQLKETLAGVETEVDTLGHKLAAKEEELTRAENECGILRLSSSQTESALSDSQRRLTSRIGELHNVQERNRALDEKNESLQRQVASLREELCAVRSAMSEVDRERETLQDQLDDKTEQLNETHRQLDDTELLIQNLRTTVDELETSKEYLRESAGMREQEVELLRHRLGNAKEELLSAATLKDATLRENTTLREELDWARLDSQAWQVRVENSAQEAVGLQRKVQGYESDVSRIEGLLATKERECREQQEARRRVSVQVESLEGQARQAEGSLAQLRLELASSNMDQIRLKERVQSLEANVEEALTSERSSSSQLTQLRTSLLQKEKDLRLVQDQRFTAQTELDKTRDLCVKLDTSKENAQRELAACREEVDLLRKQLAGERLSLRSLEAMLVTSREKELHTQLNQQEKHTQIQLLKEKLTMADSKASSQSREVAALRAHSAQLELDLEITKRQLSTQHLHREWAVQELHQGLSTSCPLHSSSSLSSPSTPRSSFSSPKVSWSPDQYK